MIGYVPETYCFYWNNSIIFYITLHFTFNRYVNPYNFLLFWNILVKICFLLQIWFKAPCTFIHRFLILPQNLILLHIDSLYFYQNLILLLIDSLYFYQNLIPLLINTSHSTKLFTLSSIFHWHHKEVPIRYLLQEVQFHLIPLYRQT